MHSIIPAHDPSGTIKNIKINRTRGHVPRAFYMPLHGPPAPPGSRPAVYTMPGPKTPYTPATGPPRVAAAAMPAGFYAAICCYASVKLLEPLHGIFMFCRYVYTGDATNAIQRILKRHSDLMSFYYKFVTILMLIRYF